MRPQDHDPDEVSLQRLFSARERRDKAAAPGFERVVRRPARAGGGRRRVAVTVSALLLIALAIVWMRHSGPAPSQPPGLPALASWKAPTDFLLAVPGGELLDSTPTFPDPSFSIQGVSE